MIQEILSPKYIENFVHLIVCKFKLWNSLVVLHFSQFILNFLEMKNVEEQKFIGAKPN